MFGQQSGPRGRSLWMLAGGLSLAVFTTAGPALAASEEGTSLGLMDFNMATFVAAVAVFVLALIVLRKAAWGPIVKAIDERERKIEESLAAAERATADAERVAKENERILTEARKEASSVVEEGKRDAEAVRARILEDAKKEAEASKDRAIAEIDRAKDNAVQEIHARAVDLSIEISEKLIHKSLSADDHKSLIDETISRYESMN